MFSSVFIFNVSGVHDERVKSVCVSEWVWCCGMIFIGYTAFSPKEYANESMTLGNT